MRICGVGSMGHSANYQMELYVTNLEKLAQKLNDQAIKLRESGHDTLAILVKNQAQQLQLAITDLRKEWILLE